MFLLSSRTSARDPSEGLTTRHFHKCLRSRAEPRRRGPRRMGASKKAAERRTGRTSIILLNVKINYSLWCSAGNVRTAAVESFVLLLYGRLCAPQNTTPHFRRQSALRRAGRRSVPVMDRNRAPIIKSAPTNAATRPSARLPDRRSIA